MCVDYVNVRAQMFIYLFNTPFVSENLVYPPPFWMDKFVYPLFHVMKLCVYPLGPGEFVLLPLRGLSIWSLTLI